MARSRPLATAAAATGLEVGDDQMALAARERLAPLLDRIEDPYLCSVARLVLAWTDGIVGDFDGSLRGASVSLEELRVQDEPFSTALAAYTAGLVEMTVGRYDDALRHLTEMRDLAERSSTTPGSRQSPGCIWAPWPSPEAGWRTPGRRWTRTRDWR